MPQCQFHVFCYFCVSEKLHRKYSRNWTKQKPKFLFYRNETDSKAETEGARERPHPPKARATPGRAGAWCGSLVHLLTSPFRLYILLDEKTLSARSIFQKHTASHCRRQREIGRVQKLFPAPCRRGKLSLEAFFITMPASGVMCE
jgi:hypothetical protein